MRLTTLTEAPAGSRAAAEQALMALIPVLRRRFQAELPAELSGELCITPHQGETLALLRGAGGEGLTMNELARAQGCALSTATAMVDRLFKLGLAERVHDEDDRRVVRITISELGRDLSARFHEVKQRVFRDTLSRLDDDEVLQLAALMRKVAAEPETTGVTR